MEEEKNVNLILLYILLSLTAFLILTPMKAKAAEEASVVARDTNLTIPEEGIALIAFDVAWMQNCQVEFSTDGTSWNTLAAWNSSYVENNVKTGRLEISAAYKGIVCDGGNVDGNDKYLARSKVSISQTGTTYRSGTCLVAYQSEYGESGKTIYFRSSITSGKATGTLTSGNVSLSITDQVVDFDTISASNVTATLGYKALDFDNPDDLFIYAETNIVDNQYDYDSASDTYALTGQENRQINLAQSDSFNPHLFFLDTSDGTNKLVRCLDAETVVGSKNYTGYYLSDKTSECVLTDAELLSYPSFSITVNWTDIIMPVITSVEVNGISQSDTEKSVEITVCAYDYNSSGMVMRIAKESDPSFDMTKVFAMGEYTPGALVSHTFQLTLTENTTLVIWVTDAVGNARRRTVTINWLDTIAPTNVSLSVTNLADLNTTSTGATFVLSADDDQPNYLSYLFYLNGKLIQRGSANECVVRENGTVTGAVKDLGEHLVDAPESYELTKVDGTAPVISDVTLRAINKSYVLATVEASDNITATENLSYTLVSYDTDYTVNDNHCSFNIYHSGTYTFVVTDEAGNSSRVEKTISLSGLSVVTDDFITDLRLTGAGNSYSYNGKVYASEGITIMPVLSSDAVLENVLYSYDGGNTYTSEASKTVTKNGVYKIVVKETGLEDGNTEMTHTATVSITGIDKSKPLGIAVKNSTQAAIIARDSASGVGKIVVYTTSQSGIKTETVKPFSGLQNSVVYNIQMDKLSGYSYVVYDNVGNATAEETIRSVPEPEDEEEIRYVWVCFLDYNNEVLKIQKIEAGKDATPPIAPTRSGFAFSGWSQPYTNLTMDVTYIRAQYNAKHSLRVEEGNAQNLSLMYQADAFLYSDPYSGLTNERTDVEVVEEKQLSSAEIIEKDNNKRPIAGTVEINGSAGNTLRIAKVAAVICFGIAMLGLILAWLLSGKGKKDEQES